MRALLLVLSTLLWCRVATADPASGSARARFEAGLAAVSRGELAAGLREFEAAYAIEPRYAVLFNIGQAQAALGRPLEAIASFERFLAEGGQQIPEARRSEVVRAIQQNRKLLGALSFKLEAPAETRVWLDGKPLSIDELARPIETVAGGHTLLHAQARGFPTVLEVRVESEQTTEVVIPKAPPEPPSGPAPSTPLSGFIAVTCQAAGLTVEVAGRQVGRTPLVAPVSASAGRVRVRFSRPDYEPVEREVSVEAAMTSRIACSLPLTPTRASVERGRAAARRRLVGYGLAGAALASLGTGAAIYGWNQGRYEDFRNERTPDRPLVDRAVSIQRADDAAVGFVILGAGLSALASWALFTTD